MEYLAGYLEAERSSREASKRATLLRRCALPAPKTFDGYDWSAVSWPEGMGRESLLALDFVERREDLVLMGDVGTGKTHMASALCALACERRLEARFFTVFFTTTKFRISRLISFGFHRFAKVPHPFFANCPIFPSSRLPRTFCSARRTQPADHDA